MTDFDAQRMRDLAVPLLQMDAVAYAVELEVVAMVGPMADGDAVMRTQLVPHLIASWTARLSWWQRVKFWVRLALQVRAQKGQH